MTPREPDRYDKQGEELACAYRTVRCPDRATLASQIAAALRAEAAEALERAAQECDEHAEYFAADRIRALKPDPAAAPAAETGKAQTIEFNINDSVWVKVTPVGEQVYRQHWTALKMDPPPLRKDADGWTEFQFWELANVFGAAMYNGGRVPVETTIRIAAPARVAPPEGEGK